MLGLTATDIFLLGDGDKLGEEGMWKEDRDWGKAVVGERQKRKERGDGFVVKLPHYHCAKENTSKEEEAYNRLISGISKFTGSAFWRMIRMYVLHWNQESSLLYIMHACLKVVVGPRWAESRKVRNKLILDSFSSRDVGVPCDACIVPDD